VLIKRLKSKMPGGIDLTLGKDRFVRNLLIIVGVWEIGDVTVISEVVLGSAANS
jgi:hypothetical protein